MSVVVGQAPAFTSAAMAGFRTSAAGSFTVTTTGYPIPALRESGRLPSSVSFHANTNGTASLSGRPLVPGTYRLTITATSTAGTTTQSLTPTVG